jgi:hypothetical protein
VLAVLSTAAVQATHAQSPTAADTAAVLHVVAAAVSGDHVRPDSGQFDITIRFWYIAPGDSLTARLAAAARYTTAAMPADAVCPLVGAPEGAPTASVTAMKLTFVGADTAVVMVSSSCRRPRPSGVGTHFAQGDSFRLVRQGGVWRVASRWYFIS